jgi:hypothetical protein
MKKYKITVERPAWIEETWIIETDDRPMTGSTNQYAKDAEAITNLSEGWMDDNAEQLGTEVLRQMDEEEMKIHGFAIYINDVEEHYEPF